MKRTIAVAVALFLAAVSPLDAQEGRKKAVIGEVVAVSCYMESPAGGARPDPNCTRTAISAGEPAGILEDSTGDFYVLIPAQGSESAAVLSACAGKTVELIGIVRERQGLRTMTVEDMRVSGQTETAGAGISGSTKNTTESPERNATEDDPG